MKITRKSWKIISMALIVGLLGAMIPVGNVLAGSLTSVSDTLSTSAANTAATHTIDFTVPSGGTAIPDNGKVVITFPATFNMGSLDSGDISSDQNGNVSWAVSGQVVTGIVTSSIATGTSITVTVGGTNQITNPSSLGSHTVSIVTKTSGDSILDTGYAGVYIGTGTGASVTVKTYISTTINDYGTTGVNFGEVDPDNVTENPDVDQDGTHYSVSVDVEAETNATVDVLGRIAGVWTGSGTSDTIPAANTKYGNDNTGSDGSYGTDYAQLEADVNPNSSAELWHWLVVPSGIDAGTYTNTLYYQAVVSNS